MTLALRILLAVSFLLLAGGPASASTGGIKAAWVVMGPGGQAQARVATMASACPMLKVDGVLRAMQLRTPAGTIPQRPTASPASESKSSEFPVSTCEYLLPANTVSTSVDGRRLPLPKKAPKRIVVIGDTGCRMKKSDDLWQDCSTPDAWPFARIARAAAALKPDLVLHVGDYQYRENPCPPDVAGCRNSPWGYGWDVWNAEVFTPAAPLLAAAPWIVVRGNHEECARGGQGWFRFFDPQPYSTARSCDDASNDAQANFSDPYVVPLGRDTQIIVFDSAKAGTAVLKPDMPADKATITKYQEQFEKVGALAAQPHIFTIFTNHHPILGLTPVTANDVISGSAALLPILKTLNATAYYPAGIQLAIHGHTHLFEAINFASDHPATLLSGNGGDHVDQPLPDPLPINGVSVEGVSIERITHSNTFGFLLMERQSDGWIFKAYRQNGSLMTTCGVHQRKLICGRTGLVR